VQQTVAAISAGMAENIHLVRCTARAMTDAPRRANRE
jgi:hypothetical protein